LLLATDSRRRHRFVNLTKIDFWRFISLIERNWQYAS